MTAKFFAKPHYLVIALTFVSFGPARTLAQENHAQMPDTQAHQHAVGQANASALIRIVRQSTARFADVAVAEREGYALRFGCVSGSDSGAMGLHYVNGALVGSDVLDATRPQIVISEPLANGARKLIGADYLVLADTWNAQHPEGPHSAHGSALSLLREP